ncbi:MAG TPA: alkaline phosphatase family protein [Verrucomicrobiae bacterium]
MNPWQNILRRILVAATSCLAFLLARGSASAAAHTNVQAVFIIVMENVSWSEIKGSPSAPYINTTLLPMSSWCAQYYQPPGFSSSLPNYLWLEAGTNFGITTSPLPASAQISSTNHLVTQLDHAGISWRTYQENISGNDCPTNTNVPYVAWHNPFLYFTDIAASASNCIAHNRPYPELARDLTNHTVARYNFIVPNLCNDMHGDAVCPTAFDRIRTGDNWLATEIPRLMNSAAYSNQGAIFLTWDESTLPGSPAVPIGMIVTSPLAKGGGYVSTNRYDHGSTLRTMQEIFGLRPFLFGAATAASLSDLFQPTVTLSSTTMQTNGQFRFTVTGDIQRKTNLVQASTAFTNWTTLGTNIAATNTLTFTDTNSIHFQRRFYRVLPLP